MWQCKITDLLALLGLGYSLRCESTGFTCAARFSVTEHKTSEFATHLILEKS